MIEHVASSIARAEPAYRMQVHRVRNHINRSMEFVERCRSFLDRAIDDDTFVALLDEAANELGLRKEVLARALDLNPATIYRWLTKKSMPQPFVRPVIIEKIIAGLGRDADELADQLLFHQRHGAMATAVPGAQLLAPFAGPRRPTAPGQFELTLMGGPPPTYASQDDRPTFAAFSWHANLESPVDLTPAAAIGDACLLITEPGVSYYCHATGNWIPIDIEPHSPGAVFFLAQDLDRPWLPAIRLRSASGDPIRNGLLLVSSGDGVPFEVVGRAQNRPHDHAVVVPSREAFGSQPHCGPATIRQVPLPVSPGEDRSHAGMIEFSSYNITNHEFEAYEHAEAVRLRNFRVLFDTQLFTTQAERRRSKKNDLHSLTTRLLVCDYPGERPSPHGTHLKSHEGYEVIVPLYGAIDVHLFDRNEAPPASGRHENDRFLTDLVENPSRYEPLIMSAGPINHEGARLPLVPQMLSLDPDRVFHGYTAFSRSGAMLCVSVKRLGMKSGWKETVAAEGPVASVS